MRRAWEEADRVQQVWGSRCRAAGAYFLKCGASGCIRGMRGTGCIEGVCGLMGALRGHAA